MTNTKLKPVWYGQKTFTIIKGFNHQGVCLYPKGLFSCDKETYEDNKQFLGEEYIQKSKKEKAAEKKEQAKALKKQDEQAKAEQKEKDDAAAARQAEGDAKSSNDTKQNAEAGNENSTEDKDLGYKIKNQEELDKLSDAGMTEKDINRDDKDGMYIKPDSKFFPKKRGIFNKIFNK